MGRDHSSKHKDKEKDKEVKESKKHRDRGSRDKEKEKDHERKKSRRLVEDGVLVEVKERDKDQEKDRARERDSKKDRDRDRERERDGGGEERERKRRKKDEDAVKEKEENNEREREREEREKEREEWEEREREKVREKEKEREREKEKERERERDREREREKDRERERVRDREKEKEREKQRERGRDKDREKDSRDGDRLGADGDTDRDRKRRRKDESDGGGARDDGKGKKDFDNEEDGDEEQKKLDEEMEKRRRRVQEWQELRRRKEEEERKKRGVVEAEVDSVASPSNLKKTWTLEGEDSDDDEDETDQAAAKNGSVEKTPPPPVAADVPAPKKEEEVELDPLDAFMNSIAIPEVCKDVSTVEAPIVEVAEKKGGPALKESVKGENGKVGRRKNRNGMGRIMPGDDSASEDEREEGQGDEGDEDDEDFLKRVKKTKAEKLAIVDHSKIQYPPFRKNFYIEVKEISRMTAEEATAYRKELELKIRGKDVPRPLKTWNQTGLNNKVLEVIKKAGFEKPMPIQSQALPIIMSGRDCIGIAKTGSGKTLAFVLPMLRHIMDQPPLVQGDGPIGLIMAPTRELVQQIYNDIKKFSKVLGLTCVPVYGGSGVAQQISDLKRGAEMVVCTPGRMIDILCTSAGKITNLRRVTYLVMDEADRMFDMGFEPQITRIVQNTRPDRQTVLFSATFPRQVEVLARKVLTKPLEIQIGGRSVVNSDITQTVEVRPDSERFLRLLELLGEWYEKGKILVFVHSQEKCDSLFKDLLKAGYPCLSLHGAKDQTDRESTIMDFKSNVCNLMIATSVAARGLDVKELELVVNYDVPNHYEDYVHRVGRTGRAGRKGCAVTFISVEEERYAPDLVKALELSSQPVPDDLKKLADDFLTKVKQGSEQAHGSGYGGSGFKFNEEEDEARKAVKKAQAREYGFEEEEDKSDSDSEDDGIRKAGGEMSQAAAIQAAALAAAAKAGLASGPAINPAAAFAGANPQLQAALASMAQVATANQVLPGGAGLPGIGFPGIGGVPATAAISDGNAAAARATAMAAAMNLQHSLAKIQGDAAPESYEAELEINDFPQHARWKVTHKDALGQISEWTGAAITTRGQYFPAGKVPSPGERKLFLFIEGPTEASVKKAKAEIKRILEESTSSAISLPGPTQPGKYSVL
ncbi:unnamed protein product [Sphagnum compactum]